MEEQHVRSPRLADHPLAGPINPAGCIIHVRCFIQGQRRTETSCLLVADRPVGGLALSWKSSGSFLAAKEKVCSCGWGLFQWVLLHLAHLYQLDKSLSFTAAGTRYKGGRLVLAVVTVTTSQYERSGFESLGRLLLHNWLIILRTPTLFLANPIPQFEYSLNSLKSLFLHYWWRIISKN